jgi:hypothetical protein
MSQKSAEYDAQGMTGFCHRENAAVLFYAISNVGPER